MPYLLDSNILLRIGQRTDPHHTLIRSALRTLIAQGEQLCFSPQNLVEFWNVCTRPATARGGYGLTPIETEKRARLIERQFTLLPDSPTIHTEWRRLVVTHTIIGASVHDTRLVAVMQVHAITHLLSLDAGDFRPVSWHHCFASCGYMISPLRTAAMLTIEGRFVIPS